jgi:CRP/FNR family cyclic AMP-dependent transcriptional regulator
MTDTPDHIAAFVRAGAASKPDGDLLWVPEWTDKDWASFFSYGVTLSIARSEVLIQNEASERAMYFLGSGLLEVTAVLNTQSMGSIAKLRPGSVVGELAFLDGNPRSAKVWAVQDSQLYRMDFDRYQQFEHAFPRQSCHLLRALGCVVALRLRRTQARLSR